MGQYEVTAPFGLFGTIRAGAGGIISDAALLPSADNAGALGASGTAWADLYLASGGVINWNAGDVTLTHAANALTFGGGDFFVADGNGVILGHTAQIPAGAVTSEFQMHGTAPADSTALLAAWSADAVPPRLYFAKSRSATIGTFGIITSGDNLGEILAFGDDGVDFNSNGNASAAIIFDSAGTIAADRVPGVILFQTATDAAPSVLTTALTIDQAQLSTFAGNLTVSNAAPTLLVNSTTGAAVVAINTPGTGQDCRIEWREGGNFTYRMFYSESANYLALTSTDTDGGGTDADIWRIPDGQTTIDANTTWDINVFDYVCETCGKHAGDPFECCGPVSWHDDVALMAVATRNEPVAIAQMEKLGLLHTYEDGQRFVSLNRMPFFLMSGLVQLSQRLQAIEEKLVA